MRRVPRPTSSAAGHRPPPRRWAECRLRTRTNSRRECSGWWRPRRQLLISTMPMIYMIGVRQPNQTGGGRSATAGQETRMSSFRYPAARTLDWRCHPGRPAKRLEHYQRGGRHGAQATGESADNPGRRHLGLRRTAHRQRDSRGLRSAGNSQPHVRHDRNQCGYLQEAGVVFSLRGQAAGDELLTLSQPIDVYIDSVNVPHPARHERRVVRHRPRQGTARYSSGAAAPPAAQSRSSPAAPTIMASTDSPRPKAATTATGGSAAR